MTGDEAMTGHEDTTYDRAIRVFVPADAADLVGAVLMDRLGAFAQENVPVAPDGAPERSCGRPTASGGPDGHVAEWSPALEPTAIVVLTFFPESAGLASATSEEILSLLPDDVDAGQVRIETSEIGRGWEEGWRDHFHPIVIGRVRVRPPWEAPAEPGLLDVVINPGLGFGTGLHPTTRGTLNLLQVTESQVSECEPSDDEQASRPGRLVDAGTGSGILSIAAAKLGWGPIIAFDNDGVALVATRQNFAENGVGSVVTLYEKGVDEADLDWFSGATVLANMTLEPVSILLRRLATLKGARAAASGGAAIEQPGTGGAGALPARLVVSGILAGEQERELLRLAADVGFAPGRVAYEAEWVSVELLPQVSGD